MDKRVFNGGNQKGAGRKPGEPTKNINFRIPATLYNALHTKYDRKLSKLVKPFLYSLLEGDTAKP